MSSEWDKLWIPDDGALPSLAEILMNSERYAPVMCPWLNRVKKEGYKLQVENKTMIDTFDFATQMFFDGETTTKEAIEVFKDLKSIEDDYIEVSEKLEAIRELLQNAPIAPEFVPDKIMEILGDE
jgi:hypothetical protein